MPRTKETEMSRKDMVYWFLKCREEVDENASLLVSLIEAGREPNADVLDGSMLEDQEKTIRDSGLSGYILYAGGQPVVIYPREQQELYLSIRDELNLGAGRKEYSGFSYSEAVAAMDYLDTAGIRYFLHTDSGRAAFAVSAHDAKYMESAIRALQRELCSGVGKQFHTVRNACWANTIGQLSRAFAYGGVSYIGSDGGTSGIRVDQDGATYLLRGKPGGYIPRYGAADPMFRKKVTELALKSLGGETSPVKAFYGDLAEQLTEEMDRGSVQAPGLTVEAALGAAGLEGMPGFDRLLEMRGTETDEGKKKALSVLMRAALCRSVHLEGPDGRKVPKLNRTDRAQYHELHAREFRQFCRECRIENPAHDRENPGTMEKEDGAR